MGSPVMIKVSAVLNSLMSRCQLSDDKGSSLFKLRVSSSGGEHQVRACVSRASHSVPNIVFLLTRSTGIQALLKNILAVTLNLLFGTGGPQFREMRLLGRLSHSSVFNLKPPQILHSFQEWSEIHRRTFGKSLVCLVVSDLGVHSYPRALSLADLVLLLLPPCRFAELHLDDSGSDRRRLYFPRLQPSMEVMVDVCLLSCVHVPTDR